MYVRTPKRYRGPQRRSVLSCRRIVVIFLMLLFIITGVGIYMNIDLLRAPVEEFISTQVANAESIAATSIAPPPTATQDPTNNLIQADNYWRQGAISESVNNYMQVLDAVPNDVSAYERVTLGLIIDGQPQQALEYAEKTITADPYSSDAWATRAWTLDWNGRPTEAISSALHALELDSNNARAMAFLAEAYNSLSQPERALTQIERALERDANSFEALSRARAGQLVTI